MKKSLILFFIIIQTQLFAFDYEGPSYKISGSNVYSKISEDKASYNGNELDTVFENQSKKRVLSNQSYPEIKTNDEIIDFLYKMAYEEVILNINKNGFFSAGANWPTAWTRDMSYAIDLSLSFLFPDIVEKSLESRVENDMIVQDTGSGGSYPVSTDRIVWGIAAYDLHLVKQDLEWDKRIYKILSETIKYDYNVNFSEKIGLFKGETSFIDWREQSYPRWMECNFIGDSFAFGTNVVYFAAMKRCAILSEKLGLIDETDFWKSKIKNLKKAIIDSFWIPEKKHYGMYIINQKKPFLYNGYENLGTSLSIIEQLNVDVDSYDILESVKEGEYGMSVFAPQIANVPPYHNDAVWPFVQGYRMLAAKNADDYECAEKEFASMIYSASMFQTFKENLVSSSFSGNTQTNSDRQLWSDAGFLCAIYKVIFGLDFTEEGLYIKPFVFKSLNKGLSLKNFKFGNSILNLNISGTGNRIADVEINGKKSEKTILLPYVEGKKYDVSIKMEEDFHPVVDEIDSVDANDFSPQIPLAFCEIDGKRSYIKIRGKNTGKILYTINGKLSEKPINGNSLVVEQSKNADIYQFFNVPIDYNEKKDFSINDYLPSSEIRIESPANTKFYEAEKASFIGGKIKIEDTDEKTARISSDLQTSIANGNSFVEKWGSSEDDYMEFIVNAKEAGLYSVDFRYENGNGPVNTGYKCAFAFLMVNGEKKDSCVLLSQTGNWSAWKWTSPEYVHLKKGRNTVKLFKSSYSRTMKNLLNPINIDLMRVSKVQE